MSGLPKKRRKAGDIADKSVSFKRVHIPRKGIAAKTI